MSQSGSIPYTIIGGYLGAGKTTLLNNLLSNSQGLRCAVLVNDFGDINIDAGLVAIHDGETINLANGCICCSLADGFMMALNRLSKRGEEIDHIIVEASGVSNPVKVGQYGAILDLSLEGVIVLVDAEQVQDKAANKYVGDTVIRQIQGADLLVLNKVDLVNSEELVEVRRWLADVAPDVKIIEATYGEVPTSVLLGARKGELLEAAVGDDDDHAGRFAHQDAYQTWSFSTNKAMREADLHAMLDDLPEEVLRAKGFVHLVEDAEHRYVLQIVGRRRMLTPGESWGGDVPQTQIVFIALPANDIRTADLE